MAYGYSVFSYDRLNIGNPTIISGWDTQALIQINVLSQLTAAIKCGKYTAAIGVPTKTLLIGQAFGSFLTAGLATQEPGIADAIVLVLETIGFRFNGTALSIRPLALLSHCFQSTI